MKRVEDIKNKFATPENFMFREMTLSGKTAVLMFNPDLVDSNLVFRIVEWAEESKLNNISLAEIEKECIFIAETAVEYSENAIISSILSGDSVVLVDGILGYLVLTTRKYDGRAISEPPLYKVTNGPREGFVEDIKINLSLIEKRIKSPDLAVKKLKVGDVSNTDVAVVYIKGVANDKIVKKLIKRLNEIKINGIIDTHYLVPFLEERPFSIFNQTGRAEKPDIISAKILEGRVAVFVNGTPTVLTLPYIFMESMQSSSDYYNRFSYTSFLRMLRYMALMFAILLPGVYVALQKYHFSILPIKFLMTLLTTTNGIPLKATMEALFVIIIFEIIRETAVRMPQAVSMAMSIVGALVLGDTAVKAGIISSPAVMIVALSSLSMYAAPDEVGSTTLLRVIFTLLGGLGGIYMLLIGVTYLVQYIVTLNGYGAPYLAPLTPFIKDDMKDGLIKSNILNLKDMPKSFPNMNKDNANED